MPRIADDELERIKSQVKVADLCREYGIELKQMGPDNLMGRCPFHDDRTPSFGVTPSKNLWNCLAGCGGGDTIQLVMKKEGVSFRQAAEVLRQRLGVAPPAAPMIKTRQGTTHSALVADTTDLADHVLLRHVLDFYHQTFCNDIKAMRYLQERRCFNAEATKLFQIGYANRTLGYRIPPAKTAAGNTLKAQLQRLGVLRESGHEHLNGCVVFPILDEHGNVAQMYGRKITPNLREGTPLHLYLPGEHRAVWNATALRAGGGQKEILLCESIIDGLTLWCAGFRNVTCAYGVNGFTDAHWKLIEEIKPKRIVNCYDNDDAGNPAAARLAPQLIARGITVVRAKLPPGKDINDVACMNKDARVALAIALETPAEIAGMDGPIVITSTATSDEAAKEKAPAPPVVVPTETAKEKKASTVTPLAASSPTDALAKPATDTDETFFNFGPRQWRVRGVGKNLAFETLRVQLRVLVQSGEQYSFHLDSLDLCNAKHRQSFIAQAHAETRLDENLLKRDLGQVYLKIEELQEKCLREAVEPKQKEVIVADAERTAAMELLKDPKLLDRILADFDRCGVVGEEVNKLVRRRELSGLKLYDLDVERGTIMVRLGKGKKDRMIPIGSRALAWIDRYVTEVRATLARQPDDGILFLSNQGDIFSPNRLTQMVREYVGAAEIGKTGACHLFRHTMATLMLENGADIRFIQQMLGHAELSTTQIYTQVSIRKLKEIHSLTHPARLEKPATGDAESPPATTPATPPSPAPPPPDASAAMNAVVIDEDAEARQRLLDALDAEAEEEQAE